MQVVTRSVNTCFTFTSCKSDKDNKTYVDYTNDLQGRLKKHNSDHVKFTKFKRPLKLLFHEEFNTSVEARKRELYWKSGGGRRKLKDMLYNETRGGIS